MKKGDTYRNIRKVYSVNIVYFALGRGKDVVYHGTTEFRGIRQNDLLELSAYQKKQFQTDEVYKIFPEYYILRVNDFNKVAKSPLEEWISYFKTGEIADSAGAPRLAEARELLKLDFMTKQELAAYYRHIDNLVILQDNIFTEREEGREEGLEKGREEGREAGREEGKEEGRLEEQRKIAERLREKGLSEEEIAAITGLPVNEL